MNGKSVALAAVAVAVVGAMSYYIVLSMSADLGEKNVADNVPQDFGQYRVRDFTNDFVIMEVPAPPEPQQASFMPVNGSWRKEAVTVWTQSERFDGAFVDSFLQELLDPSAGWNAVLHEKRETFGSAVPVLSLGTPNDADIVITLREPNGEPSRARLLMDHDTIVRAEITVIVTGISDRELLMAVANHELGHALGLGHSTDEASVMSGTISVVDGRPVTGIGACESKAIEQAYVEGRLDDVTC